MATMDEGFVAPRQGRAAPLTEARAAAPGSGAPATPVRRAAGPSRRPVWETSYAHALVVVDAAMITVAAFVSLVLRFGESPGTVGGVSYSLLSAFLAPVWIGLLGASRAYESRYMGVGSEEYKRVFDASVRLLACVATLAFALQLDLARGFVALALPLGTALLLIGRYSARRVLHRLRVKGRARHRVVVVGTRDAATRLVAQAHSAPYAGFSVVGACIADGGEPLVVGAERIPVLGLPDDAAAVLTKLRADTVAVAGGWQLGDENVRRLAWELEGTGVDLVVAPALTNVAGPRIHIRPVAGLPLLHVEEPEFTGGRRLLKSMFDRTLALLLLLACSPFVVTGALAVALTSPGGPFFRQTRVGIGGREFRVWKLRTMYADAEARRAELLARNEHDGVLFKIRRDPRVTPVGRLLRRWSIDEMPQLLNVVAGDMSLVGPRPPLPSEVAEYETDVRRRLLVKPGVTGLWQVSGRSDLSWEESVRLDLLYVENWSIAFDFSILWKTLGAVVRGRGAY